MRQKSLIKSLNRTRPEFPDQHEIDRREQWLRSVQRVILKNIERRGSALTIEFCEYGHTWSAVYEYHVDLFRDSRQTASVRDWTEFPSDAAIEDMIHATQALVDNVETTVRNMTKVYAASLENDETPAAATK